MQWLTIYKKEMLEYWRNFSWVWVPVVFILLAIMDPLTTYYMPIILDKVGGLPDGAVIELPQMAATDVLMMSLSEFSSIGVIIIVAITMGIIAGERKSGVVELVLVKPVRYANYISSKWAAKLTLILVSYTIALLTSWYYVSILFEEIALLAFVQTLSFYALWLILVVTITIFYNTLLKTPGLVGALSVGTIIGMTAINAIFSHKLTWFPNNLSSYIRQLLHTGEIPTALWGTSFVTISLIVALLFLSFYTFQKKELA
ncbi:putative transmembrane protein YxlG [Paraliobacillus quinghaiensis]|uniref:Transmembrane protein YxlG n=1 Tax=Paraliobacillus quinghaiensis TaxID=470815 RepID=A0A917TP39_9BACI|nr:ABC transporter permease subunit [Paraliobacillus quinghaiensis]GGM29991.1 putative transmembrane protein YxlG [Paraliobacillus quinghaiensis]